MPKGRVFASIAATALLVIGLVGCSGYVRRGEALYADGRYVEAAEVFERTEQRLSQSSPRQQAEYGLYRGLTLLVLGDLPNAHRWLTYAYSVERAAPGSLGSDRRAMLDDGWQKLGQRMRVPPPHTAATAVASRTPAPERSPPVALPNSGSGIDSSEPSGAKRSLVPETR